MFREVLENMVMFRKVMENMGIFKIFKGGDTYVSALAINSVSPKCEMLQSCDTTPSSATVIVGLLL